jgi:hypothetical protein
MGPIERDCEFGIAFLTGLPDPLSQYLLHTALRGPVTLVMAAEECEKEEAHFDYNLRNCYHKPKAKRTKPELSTTILQANTVAADDTERHAACPSVKIRRQINT